MLLLQELEQIEDSWRKETRELVETVARLQDDNRKLRSTVNNHQLATDAANSKYLFSQSNDR